MNLSKINLYTPKQHAYVKGSSVDLAIHNVILKIEKAFSSGQQALGAFLNIVGAFNMIRIHKKATKKFGVSDIVIPIVDRSHAKR